MELHNLKHFLTKTLYKYVKKLSTGAKSAPHQQTLICKVCRHNPSLHLSFTGEGQGSTMTTHFADEVPKMTLNDIAYIQDRFLSQSMFLVASCGEQLCHLQLAALKYFDML